MIKPIQIIKQNKKYLALTILFEIMFLFSLITLQYYYLLPGMEATQTAITQMQETINQLPDAEVPQLETYLMSNTEFMQSYKQLLNFILSFLASTFIAYIIFKTIAWHYTFKMIHKKIPIITTLIKFPLLTIFWTIITIILIAIFLKVNNEYTYTPKILLAISLITIYYFSQVSYSIIPAQKTFRQTFKTQVIKTYIINLIILTIATGIPILTIKYPSITIFLIIILTVPAIIFTRLNLINASWKHKV